MASAGADFALDCDNYPFEQDAQAVITAIKEGNEGGVYCLLKHGADKDMKAKNGKNAMMIAKGKGDQIAMKILS